MYSYPLGSLNQLGVVLGIMSTQIAGFVVATPTLWRLVLFASAGLAVVQLLVSPFIIESPVWLQTQSRNDEVDAIRTKLYQGLLPREGACFTSFPRTTAHGLLIDDVEDPLLAGGESEDTPLAKKESVTIPAACGRLSALPLPADLRCQRNPVLLERDPWQVVSGAWGVRVSGDHPRERHHDFPGHLPDRGMFQTLLKELWYSFSRSGSDARRYCTAPPQVPFPA
jgi:hypothetical protein